MIQQSFIFCLLIFYSLFAQEAWHDCPRCDASGTLQECSACKRCEKNGQSIGYIRCPICEGLKIEICWTCNGRTYLLGSCRTCKGTGYIQEKRCPTCKGMRLQERKCPTCEGRGQVTCSNCDGEGYILCPLCFGRKFRCLWLRCPLCEGAGGWYGDDPPGN